MPIWVVGDEDFEENLGFGELLEQGGVVVVEWAERIAGLLPANHIDVRIVATGESSREIRISSPTRLGVISPSTPEAG